jgi:membrane-associated phospholipid phosphatase
MRYDSRVRGILACLLLALTPVASVFAQQVTLPAEPAPVKPTVEPVCARQDISTLFRCTWQDFRQLGQGSSLTWLVAGSGLAGLSVLLDDEVSKSLRDDNPDQSLALGGPLGEAGLHFGLPAALYVGAWLARSAEAEAVAVTVLRAQVINGIVTRSLKMVPRARPNQVGEEHSRGSFPSGHTSAAFATATVVQRQWGWKVGLPAYLVATYVGASRLQNLHYLSDVTFGAALGIASGLAVKTSTSRVSVSPMLAPGVTGVSLTLHPAAQSRR